MAWVLENDLPGVNATGPAAGGDFPLPDLLKAGILYIRPVKKSTFSAKKYTNFRNIVKVLFGKSE
jgi:hypothetical protein